MTSINSQINSISMQQTQKLMKNSKIDLPKFNLSQNRNQSIMNTIIKHNMKNQPNKPNANNKMQ